MTWQILSKSFSFDEKSLLKTTLLKNNKIYESRGRLYISSLEISDIEMILKSIPEDAYFDWVGWKPDEVILDFTEKTITLNDYF